MDLEFFFGLTWFRPRRRTWRLRGRWISARAARWCDRNRRLPPVSESSQTRRCKFRRPRPASRTMRYPFFKKKEKIKFVSFHSSTNSWPSIRSCFFFFFGWAPFVSASVQMIDLLFSTVSIPADDDDDDMYNWWTFLPPSTHRRQNLMAKFYFLFFSGARSQLEFPEGVIPSSILSLSP